MLVRITTMTAQNCAWLFQMALCVCVEMDIFQRVTRVWSSPITKLLRAVRHVTFSVRTTFVASTAVTRVMATMIVVMVQMRT
jgi:hypothetical protein